MALRRSFALLSLAPSNSTIAPCCSRASTSTAHLLGARSAAPTAQPSSAFHTSAPVHEKKRKMAARLRKKANLARREKAQEILKATAPDPIRGFGPNNDSLWHDSELKKILLFPEEVYAGQAGLKGMLPQDGPFQYHRLGPKGMTSARMVSATAPASSSSSSGAAIAMDASNARLDGAETAALSAPPVAPYYNYGITQQDATLLFEDLPSATETLLTANNTSEQRADNTPIIRQTEEHKANATRSIIDLMNANARGIRWENTRRVIQRFGQGEGPGRIEVQAALLTMRIHNMADHIQTMPRDVHSRRHLTRLVMDRAKHLRYLKRYSLQRYVQCLKDIGVEQRAVEGSVVVKF